jgi:hypothetical protein
LKEAARLERPNFSISHGFSTALVVTAPLVVALAAGHPEFVFATLGAMMVINTEGPNAAPLPLHVLLLACFTEASAFALGTLAGLTGILAIPLVGLGVFFALVVGGNQALGQLGKYTAIFFAVGVGLPGGSTGGAVERLWLSLLGGLLALLGLWLHRSLTSKKASGGASKASETWQAQLRRYTRPARPSAVTLQSEAFRHSIAIGAASALGLTVGLALGLPRDFWVVVTIIIALRPKLGPTVSFAAMMAIGTIAGAAIAAAITFETSDVFLLEGLLLVFATMMFALRGVNLGLSQVFVTPFIIILLNLLYPGQWQLAEFRILDVSIGGAISILTVYLVRVGFLVQRFGRMRRAPHSRKETTSRQPRLFRANADNQARKKTFPATLRSHIPLALEALDVIVGRESDLPVYVARRRRCKSFGLRSNTSAKSPQERAASRRTLHSSRSCTPRRFDRFRRSWAT